MRVALPLRDGQFCEHFGKCDGVLLADVDLASGQITQPRTLARSRDGCETMPQWLADLAVELVIAGGIGGGAQAGLAQRGISVSFGHSGADPMSVLQGYVANPNAQAGANPCGDHDHDHQHCRH